MKKASRLKVYITFILTALLIAAWVVNALGQIKGTFKYEPHWTLILVFCVIVGGGVFEISAETLSLLRGFLKRGDDFIDDLLEQKSEDSEDGKK